MKNILYIDDAPIKRRTLSEKIENALGTTNWKVYRPEGVRTSQLLENTIAIFENERINFELLILDIDYDGDQLGGLKLYIEIEKTYRDRWKSVLVFSKLEDIDDKAVTTKINNFLIDRNLGIDSWVNGEQVLIERIQKLFGKI